MPDFYTRTGNSSGRGNLTSSGDQVAPRTAALPSGDAVLVWVDFRNGASNPDIFARLVDGPVRTRNVGPPEGVVRVVPPEFLVQGGAGFQTNPAVAALTDGRFVISWSEGSGVMFRIFTVDSDFRGQSVTGPILVDPGTDGFLGSSSLSPIAGGGFAIAWDEHGTGVSWQLFDSAGVPLGGPVAVGAADLSHVPANPEIIAVSDGGFALVYEEQDQDPASPASEPRLVVNIYDAAGNLTHTTAIGEGTANADIAALAGGGFVLVYEAESGVRAQRFDAAGNPLGTEIRVETIADGFQGQPAVIATPAGGFFVTWHDQSGFGGANTSSTDHSPSIKGQIYDASGNRIGSEFLVNEGASATPGVQQRPDIAILANGQAQIVYQTTSGILGEEVVTRLFNRSEGEPNPIFFGNDGPNNQSSLDDKFRGTGLNETFYGRGGRDEILGDEGDDNLFGGTGDDYIEGGPPENGRDYLVGEEGNDTFVVDFLDTVIEQIGGGIDIVGARTGFRLNAGAEIETLLAFGDMSPIYLVGNEFSQTLVGNDGANYLDGGGGADLLIGGKGNDTFLVDSDDNVDEKAGEGIDNVAARSNYVLTPGQSIEVLSTADHGGTAPISLTGNQIGQSVIGNAGNNYLDGGGGADFLQGLAGDDTMIVDADDRVLELAGGGHDNVASSASFTLQAGAHVEVLSTTDHAGITAINLTGNEFGQTIIGNAGNNVLNGGLGIDALQGLGGADTFAFTTPTVNDNIDFILDFVTTVDRIALDNAIFTGLAEGPLPADAFRIGTSAQDADDRIIYDPATGILLFDPDGTGTAAAQHFTSLQPGTPIVASDFIVI